MKLKVKAIIYTVDDETYKFRATYLTDMMMSANNKFATAMLELGKSGTFAYNKEDKQVFIPSWRIKEVLFTSIEEE